MSEQELPREIRCVLIPAGRTRLLLPNATVAEVISMPSVQPIADAPDWVLGHVAWRGWKVPLVSYTKLAQLPEADAELLPRVAVLKAPSGYPHLPFVAIITHGVPRLTTLNAELIIPTHDGNALPPGTSAHVLVRDNVAMIPDLEAIEADLLPLETSIPASAVVH